MTDTIEEREAELRGKLVKRLAVAGVMVGVLLAALAFFDYLAAPEEPEAPVYNKPVPVAPKKEVTQPVKAAELPEPPAKEEGDKGSKEEKAAKEEKPVETKPEAKAEEKPARDDKTAKAATKPVEAPVKAVVPAKPAGADKSAAAKPVTPPAQVRPAAEPSVKPVAAATKGVPEMTAAPVSKTPEESTQSPAKSAPAATAAAPARTAQPLVSPAPSLPRLLSGYVVQAGVFTNTKAAEELHAKLAINGIPSTLEARVSVGPFKTREEAEAARAKLKALGIDPLLIPPQRK